MSIEELIKNEKELWRLESLVRTIGEADFGSSNLTSIIVRRIKRLAKEKIAAVNSSNKS